MRLLLAASSSGVYLAGWILYMVRLARGEGAFDFWPLMPSGGPLPTFALGLVVFFLGVLWPMARGRPLAAESKSKRVAP